MGGLSKRRAYVLSAVLIIVVVLAIASQVSITLEPRLSKVSYTGSGNPVSWVGRDESLRANFSGHFYVIITRSFDKIRLWITPREGARTLYIKVVVKREFLNALYLEVEPPWYGKVEISRGEDRGTTYIIQVRDLGEAGDGTYELTFVDRAPEERLMMQVTVEVRDDLFKYQGTLSAVVLEPFYAASCTG
ncbi:hypothetical protein [Thermococcus atlanticus]